MMMIMDWICEVSWEWIVVMRLDWVVLRRLWNGIVIDCDRLMCRELNRIELIELGEEGGD